MEEYETCGTMNDGTELQLLGEKDTAKDEPGTDCSNLDTIPPELLETYYCGCGPCHPRFLQIFANKKFFTFLLSVFTLLEGAVMSGMFTHKVE